MNILKWDYDEPITKELLEKCVMVAYYKEGMITLLNPRNTIGHKYIIKQTTDYPWMAIQPRYEKFTLTTISLKSKSTFFEKLSILNEKFGPTSVGGMIVKRDPKDDEYLIPTEYLEPRKHTIENLEAAEYYNSLDEIAIIPDPLTLEEAKKRKEVEEPFRKLGWFPIHDDLFHSEDFEKYQTFSDDTGEIEEEFITLIHKLKIVELENSTNKDGWLLSYEEIKMLYNRIIQVEKEAQ